MNPLDAFLVTDCLLSWRAARDYRMKHPSVNSAITEQKAARAFRETMREVVKVLP